MIRFASQKKENFKHRAFTNVQKAQNWRYILKQVQGFAVKKKKKKSTFPYFSWKSTFPYFSWNSKTAWPTTLRLQLYCFWKCFKVWRELLSKNARPYHVTFKGARSSQSQNSNYGKISPFLAAHPYYSQTHVSPNILVFSSVLDGHLCHD